MGEWRRPSGCSSHSCIEVRLDDNDCWISIRGPRPFHEIRNGEQSWGLMFDPEEWETFVAAVKAGEFDNVSVI